MIIGILGKKGSGKDTVADIIIELLPQYKKKAFADNIKKVCSIITGIPLENWYNQDLKEFVLPNFWPDKKGQLYTYRTLMQTVGTDAIRDIVNDDVWIDGILPPSIRPNFAKNYEYLDTDIVISDVRHEKEYKRIKSLNGIIIKVIRQNIVSTDTHSSETQIDSLEGDYYVFNHSTIERLRTEINNILIMGGLK